MVLETWVIPLQVAYSGRESQGGGHYRQKQLQRHKIMYSMRAGTESYNQNIQFSSSENDNFYNMLGVFRTMRAFSIEKKKRTYVSDM